MFFIAKEMHQHVPLHSLPIQFFRCLFMQLTIRLAVPRLAVYNPAPTQPHSDDLWVHGVIQPQPPTLKTLILILTATGSSRDRWRTRMHRQRGGENMGPVSERERRQEDVTWMCFPRHLRAIASTPLQARVSK